MQVRKQQLELDMNNRLVPNRKGVPQGCILSPCLFNVYAEYIMRNAGLEEAEARIKIARRNINNLRYADDTTLMAESEEELKSICLQYGRPEFDLWVRNIPWRRKWQPTPVFLPGKFHGWRSLVGCSPWGR